MKSSKDLMSIYCILFIAIHTLVNGHPMVNKNEKQYPNGTVIGKYTYKDSEGNPIHVKYFADDASYGVELKSVKVINTNSDSLQAETQIPLQINDDPLEVVLDPFASLKSLSALNKNLTLNFIHDHNDKAKGSRKEDSKHSDDYEIFLQNELKAPEKCGKEKVKIYFDKDKRKTRNAMKKQNAVEYCNRF